MVWICIDYELDTRVIPTHVPVIPHPSVTIIDLHQGMELYKRAYHCQQSALELFYRFNGFTDSLFLFFRSQVGLILCCYQ